MLRVPGTIVEATLRTFASCGKGCCECVLYWTGPSATPGVVDGWDHPTHRRSLFGYQLEDRWLTQYWFRLAREGRSIRAQLHTHPGSAFHSATDDHWPIVSQAGFISIVVPYFARSARCWGEIWTGTVTKDGTWREAPAHSLLEVVP